MRGWRIAALLTLTGIIGSFATPATRAATLEGLLMPGPLSSMDLIPKILAEEQGVKIVVLTMQDEPAFVRERHGRGPFGQSVLLARRLVEAGVALVQVNWYRGPDEPPANPCWDSHAKMKEGA